MTLGRTPEHGVLLTVSYDGEPFSGYAKQTNGRTVAGELEGAIRVVDPRASATRGVSRTDAGVHARRQLVAFDSGREIASRGWLLALNQELPQEIAVVAVAKTEPGFDARDYVRQKTYGYSILASRTREPLLDRRAWRVHNRLNQLQMSEALQVLVGEHDFRAFRGAADQRTDTVRRILRIDVTASTQDERLLVMRITGDRFLYNMVRIIAGTLVDIGRERRPPDCFARALSSGLRTDLGVTAPPHGLVLEAIELDDVGLAKTSDGWPPETCGECRVDNGVAAIDGTDPLA